MAGVNYKIGADVGSFNQGVSEAQASLKTLDAALKVNEASFKAGGDAQVYMQQKTQLLTDKMNKQKQLVTQLQQGLRQMREQGVSPTSTAYQQLETKLLNAQTAMLETKTSIDNLDGSQQEATKSANDLSTAVNSIGKKVSLDQVLSAINSITGAMEKAAGKAVQLGETIWSNVMDSARWADDTATMALMYDISVEKLLQVQKLVAEGADFTAESVLNSQAKLNKNIGSGNKATLETLNELHIALSTVTGEDMDILQRRDPSEVFFEAGKALLEMSDAYDKEAAAQALFGKSWKELVPLFEEYKSVEEWNNALNSMNTESEEDVSKLAQLNDEVSKLKSNFETLSHEVWAAMAPALTEASKALSGMLESLIKYMNTPQGQEMLESLGSAVSGLFDDLGKIDPDKVVENLAGVFEDLKNGFQWIADNKKKVMNALLDIAGTFALMKVTESVLTFLKLAQGFVGLNGDTATQTTGTGIQTGPVQGPPQAANGTNTYGSGVEVLAGVTIGGAIGGVSLSDYIDEFMEIRSKKSMDEIRQMYSEKLGIDIGERGTHGFGVPEDVAETVQETAETMEDLFEETPVEVETQPIIDENAAADIAAQVGTVEIPAVLMVTSDKSGPYTKLGSFSAGSPLVYYSKDLNEHANGIWSVPFDNYPALLHKNERVVTASEANTSYNSNLYVEKMIMNNSTDANGLASAMAAAQRRRMSGYGS